MNPQLPIAFRATAYWGRSFYLKRRFRCFHYDARFADGTEEIHVHYDTVLQGGRYPADAHVVRKGAESACPEVGTGPWVDYPWGKPLTDP
ncbi:hypothetical protein [Paeniglutamicibacter cryotolerans]|uniref:Uncharacterized protein n=1 Tax=Paeniglutamicibacter cryotolerans TaxID=670079 RepID=A0A839QTD5_9MICC|nr:hypothetical protein [Paeniglutamicibacter cryotolerans]MBB2995301.1 hypothetical protein [Paeniglutamicibacter cryotolerans]